MRVASQLLGAVRRWLGSLPPRFQRGSPLRVVRIGELPERLSTRHLYVVGEGGKDWYAAMICPCGCGATIDLNLVPPGRPCWKLTTDTDGSPTLWPSIWRTTDCRAHFFVRRGRIEWARDTEA